MHPSHVAAHGKLPASGDFVSFGLDAGSLKAWDRWLAYTVTETEKVFAADWPRLWDAEPAWHMWLAGGVVHATPALAIWTGSRDRVGRRFPFTLLSFHADLSSDVLLAHRADRWCEAAVSLICAAKRNDVRLSALPDALAALPPPLGSPAVDGGAAVPLWTPSGQPLRPDEIMWLARSVAPGASAPLACAAPTQEIRAKLGVLLDPRPSEHGWLQPC